MYIILLMDRLNTKTKVIIITSIVAVLVLIQVALYFINGRKSTISLDKVDISDLEEISLDNLPEGFTVNQSMLLVNHEHPLPDVFSADISFYKTTDVLMNSAITEDYSRLSAYILDTYDNHLYVSSTYRSREDQERVLSEEGSDTAAQPGESEHETGLALDVYVMYYAGAGFLNCPEGQYVNNSCGDYGFIIRYPNGRQNITGIKYEPWHIRYVGFPHSQIIMDSDSTLEEYNSYFEVGSWYSYENYLISKQPADHISFPAGCSFDSVVISPDNTGCVFVTISNYS